MGEGSLTLNKSRQQHYNLDQKHSNNRDEKFKDNGNGGHQYLEGDNKP